MRTIIIILTIICFQTVYSQNRLAENIIIIDRIIDCYSDNLDDIFIPMKINIIYEYYIEI